MSKLAYLREKREERPVIILDSLADAVEYFTPSAKRGFQNGLAVRHLKADFEQLFFTVAYKWSYDDGGDGITEMRVLEIDFGVDEDIVVVFDMDKRIISANKRSDLVEEWDIVTKE